MQYGTPPYKTRYSILNMTTIKLAYILVGRHTVSFDGKSHFILNFEGCNVPYQTEAFRTISPPVIPQ